MSHFMMLSNAWCVGAIVQRFGGKKMHVPNPQEWYGSLQQALEQTVKQAYDKGWCLGDKHSLSADLFSIPGVCEINRFDFREEEEELWIYVTIGKEFTEAYRVQIGVYQMLAAVGERYLVLVPFSSPEMLQFWFMLGTASHGHIGRVIVTKEENPHITMRAQ